MTPTTFIAIGIYLAVAVWRKVGDAKKKKEREAAYIRHLEEMNDIRERITLIEQQLRA